MRVNYPLPSRTTPAGLTPNPARLRAARPALRQAGSAVLDTCEFLSGRDLITATYLIDAADRLLRRFVKLEQRAP